MHDDYGIRHACVYTYDQFHPQWYIALAFTRTIGASRLFYRQACPACETCSLGRIWLYHLELVILFYDGIRDLHAISAGITHIPKRTVFMAQLIQFHRGFKEFSLGMYGTVGQNQEFF